MKRTTILIPTYERPDALVTTLTSVYFQEETVFDVIVSDQSTSTDISSSAVLRTLQRLFLQKRITLTILKHFPRKGLAEQRQFLLDQCKTPYCLFLDDDVILERFVLKNLLQIIKQYECGFVGNAVIGLSFMNDIRYHEQQLEFWSDKISPEKITPNSKEWSRHKLHNAANVWHVQTRLGISEKNPIAYKIAWIGGCVLYDTQKLIQAGGYRFWEKLPVNHCGEDVMAQLAVMQKFGGCGILPSGAYHLELETTVTDRTINAPEFLINDSK